MEEEGGEGGNMERIGKGEEKMGGWEMEISLKELIGYQEPRKGKNDKAREGKRGSGSSWIPPGL